MKDLPVNKMPGRLLPYHAIREVLGCISIELDFQDNFFDVLPGCDDGAEVAELLRKEGVLPDIFQYSHSLYGCVKVVEGNYALRLEFAHKHEAERFVLLFNNWMKCKRRAHSLQVEAQFKNRLENDLRDKMIPSVERQKMIREAVSRFKENEC